MCVSGQILIPVSGYACLGAYSRIMPAKSQTLARPGQFLSKGFVHTLDSCQCSINIEKDEFQWNITFCYLIDDIDSFSMSEFVFIINLQYKKCEF